MRRLCHGVPAHIGAIESIFRSSVAPTATIAGAHVSHLQVAHHRYCTWAAMVTYRVRDREQWLTAAMCDTLQLNRASCHRVVRPWQMDVVGTALRVDEWSHSHAQWRESLRQKWGLLLSNGKRLVTECECLCLATLLKRRCTRHNGRPCLLVLTWEPDVGEPWEFQLIRSPRPLWETVLCVHGTYPAVPGTHCPPLRQFLVHVTW